MPFVPRYQPTFSERYPVPLLAAITDISIVIASSYLAHLWRFGKLAMDGHYTLTTFLFAFLLVSCLWACGVYSSWRGKSFINQLGLSTPAGSWPSASP